MWFEQLKRCVQEWTSKQSTPSVPRSIFHANVCILVSYQLLSLPDVRHDPTHSALWSRRSSRSTRGFAISRRFRVSFLRDDLRLAGNAKEIHTDDMNKFDAKYLPVDILCENPFRVRIVLTVAHSVLSTSRFQLYSLHAHSEHHRATLNERHSIALRSPEEKTRPPNVDIITGMRSLTLFSPKFLIIRSSSL